MTTATATQPDAASRRDEERFEPIAGLLAVLWPGAGHLYLGEVRRGLLIMAGVLGLFFGGLFIGGIDVVDRREDPVWFFGQALTGPLAFATDWVHQNRFKGWPVQEFENARLPAAVVADVAAAHRRSPGPDETIVVRPYDDPTTIAVEAVPLRVVVPAEPGQGPPSVKSLARMNELGTLFATIGGMLNLIVILDAAMHARWRRSPGQEARP